MALGNVSLTNPLMDGSGQQTSLDATITNNGGESGTAEVELKLGSWVVDTKSVTIDAGGTSNAYATAYYDDVINNLGAGGYEAHVTLLSGPNWESQSKKTDQNLVVEDGGGGGSTAIQVTSLAEPATTPSPGDTVEVTATLENTGDAGGTSDIPVYVNGNQAGTVNEYLGTGEKASFGVGIDIPDTDPVSVSVGSKSVEFPVDTGGNGGEEPSGGGIVDQIISFAKDNPYAVGAGALAAGYLVVGDGGGRTIVRSRPSRRTSQPRGQGGENTGTQK